MRIFSLSFLTLLFALTSIGAEKPVIRVLAPEFEGFANPNGTGVIVEAGKTVFKRMGLSIDLKVDTPLRTVKMFFEKKSDCFLGGSLQLFRDYGMEPPESDLVESDFFYVGRFTLLALKKNQIQGLKAVRGKRVGVFSFEKALFKKNFPYPVQIQEIKTREQGYMLLTSKRIDFFFDTFPLVPKYFEQVSFSESMVLYRARHRIICHKGSAPAERLTELDQEIHKLKTSGGLSAILTKYYGSNQLRHIKINE